jgi:hypothetical protein
MWLCKNAVGSWYPAQTISLSGNPLSGGSQSIFEFWNFTASVPPTVFNPPVPCTPVAKVVSA